LIGDWEDIRMRIFTFKKWFKKEPKKFQCPFCSEDNIQHYNLLERGEIDRRIWLNSRGKRIESEDENMEMFIIETECDNQIMYFSGELELYDKIVKEIY
jgi:hypothetical protein